MAKKNKAKQEKEQKKFIFFLVEGDSDIIALETPLSEMIFENQSEDYEVRFLLQQKYVSADGEEFDVDEDDEFEDEYIVDDEPVSGGDITSSSFVEPKNIEVKITNRFIMPEVKKGGGLYPKNISKIIQIVDLDGVFIPDECVIPLQEEHKKCEGPFYNTDKCVIETDDIEEIVARNNIKRRNIDYLYSLSSTGIKIKTRTIPYEIYFFSSNMDHFINNDANVEGGKKRLADKFLRKYGLDTEEFCKFFFEDTGSIGKKGYSESWDMIREGNNSIVRYTNIDCLIQKLLDGDI